MNQMFALNAALLLATATASPAPNETDDFFAQVAAQPFGTR